MIKEITSDNFKEEVLKNDKTALVDFNADWCGPCRMLRPILEELASELDKVEIVSINVDEEESLALEYNVSSIPCLVVIENGKEINRSIGLISKEEVINLIKGE